MAALPARESMPARAVRGHSSPLPGKPRSSPTDRCRPLRRCASPEIPAPILKCCRLRFALPPERKWRTRCPPPNKAAATSLRKPRSAIPRTRLRWSRHLQRKHKQFRRRRAWRFLPAVPSWPSPTHSGSSIVVKRCFRRAHCLDELCSRAG